MSKTVRSDQVSAIRKEPSAAAKAEARRIMKKRKRKRTVYTVLEVFFILILAVALVRLGLMAYDYYKGDKIYEGANEFISGLTEDEDALNVDLAGLQEINSEIIGWITIPDTEVSYPLLHTDNNSYYLKHTYDHTYSAFGSIFVDKDCSADLTDTHTLIYGHNTKNGSMFGSLKKYKDVSYFNEHPYIKIVLSDKTLTYRIISCYTVETDEPVYQLTFSSDAEYLSWYRDIVSNSVISCNAPAANANAKAITLSTCTSRTETERFVVNAVLESVD